MFLGAYLRVESSGPEREIFKHTYVLYKALKKNIDLLKAINLTEDLTNEIESMRQNTEYLFSYI